MSLGHRCANDCLGYCLNPDPPTGEKLFYKGSNTSFLATGSCAFVPASCDDYQTLTQVLPDLSLLDKKRPPQNKNKKPIPSYL